MNILNFIKHLSIKKCFCICIPFDVLGLKTLPHKFFLDYIVLPCKFYLYKYGFTFLSIKSYKHIIVINKVIQHMLSIYKYIFIRFIDYYTDNKSDSKYFNQYTGLPLTVAKKTWKPGIWEILKISWKTWNFVQKSWIDLEFRTKTMVKPGFYFNLKVLKILI